MMRLIVKIAVCIILCLAVFFCVRYFDAKTDREELLIYMPELSHCNLNNVNIKKIYADPSYNIPYTVLIKFDSNDLEIFERTLNLKKNTANNYHLLKSTTWEEVIDMYFDMKSFNSKRYLSMKAQQQNVKWWTMKGSNPSYAAPYLDDEFGKKKIQPYGQNNNGRIVGNRVNNTY